METEFKFALTKQEYALLKKLTDPRREKRQSNTYFDDEKMTLLKNKAGLRLRLENGRAYLTLKQDSASTARKTGSGLHSRFEWETRLASKGASLLLKPSNEVTRVVAKRFGTETLGNLRPIGTLKTWRRPLPLGPYLAELDRWTVGKRIFYELELETNRPAQARQFLKVAFRQLGIQLRPRRTTKLATLIKLTKEKSR